MMKLTDLKRKGAVIALVVLVPTAVSAAGPEDITIGLSYSEASLEQLDQLSEQVIVSATYSATPAPASKTETNEIGVISLGSDEVQVPPSQDDVTLPVDGLVLPDNILSCDFFEGPLEKLREAGIELHCFLISENAETQFKS